MSFPGNNSLEVFTVMDRRDMKKECGVSKFSRALASGALLSQTESHLKTVLLRPQSYSVSKLSLHFTLSVLIMGYSQEANSQKPSFISAVHGLSRL